MGSFLAEVLPYWHANVDQAHQQPFDRYKAWYAPDPEERFADLIDTLLVEPTGARDIPNTVGTVLVLDQFTRRRYGKQAKAYAGHDLAADIAGPLLSHGRDISLQLIERIAMAMALCNTEQLAHHDLALEWFSQRIPECEDEERQLLADFQEIAERRREIVRLYGRFPPRNQALGRASTPAEAYMLVGHGYEFE